MRSLVSAAFHHLSVPSIDKFPRMSDYVVPPGVRIAGADLVRLGAHLAAGTTVMHEGFVNFNAGTLGESKVEGHITPGVTVGKTPNIGVGATSLVPDLSNIMDLTPRMKQPIAVGSVPTRRGREASVERVRLSGEILWSALLERFQVR